MKADIAIFLADGFEEVEALTVSDILRRAKADIKLVSVKNTKEVESSRNVKVIADATFDEMDFSETRMLVLPGGMPGTNNLQAFKPLEELVLSFANSGKYVAAICAAPKILGALGLLKGRRACCHPGFEKELIGADVIMNRPAVLDGNIITGRSMGCAIPFGLTVLGALEGAETATEMAEKIVWMPIEYNDIG